MDRTAPYIHRIQCAAITNGCTSSLMFESQSRDPGDEGRRLLDLNGWWLDHGRWVCGNHERPADGGTDG